MRDAPTLAWVETTAPGTTYHAVTGHTTKLGDTTRCGQPRGTGVAMTREVAGAYRFVACGTCWTDGAT